MRLSRAAKLSGRSLWSLSRETSVVSTPAIFTQPENLSVIEMMVVGSATVSAPIPFQRF